MVIDLEISLFLSFSQHYPGEFSVNVKNFQFIVYLPFLLCRAHFKYIVQITNDIVCGYSRICNDMDKERKICVLYIWNVDLCKHGMQFMRLKYYETNEVQAKSKFKWIIAYSKAIWRMRITEFFWRLVATLFSSLVSIHLSFSYYALTDAIFVYETLKKYGIWKQIRVSIVVTSNNHGSFPFLLLFFLFFAILHILKFIHVDVHFYSHQHTMM